MPVPLGAGDQPILPVRASPDREEVITDTTYQYDRERVRTDDLAVVLNQWIAECDAQDPVARMAELTGMDARALTRIRNRETKSTSFFLADKILTKLDFDGALRDGRIRRPGQKHAPYHKTTIDCAAVRPHTRELVERCGGAPQAARYALVTPQTVNRILNGSQCSIQRATARKLLLALEHRREEDAFAARLRLKRQQDVIEDNRERLVGY